MSVSASSKLEDMQRELYIYRTAVSLARVAFWRYTYAEEAFSHWSFEYDEVDTGPLDPYESDEEMLEAVHPEDRDRVRDIYNRAWDEETGFEVTYRTSPGEGPVRWLFERAEIEYGDDGAAVAMIGVLQDVTTEMLARQALAREEKAATINTLITGLVHNLGNYLQPITILSHGITKKLPEDSPDLESMTTIRDSSERASRLIRDILALSRDEPGKREKFDIAGMLESTLDIATASGSPGVDVIKTLDPDIGKADGDESALSTAIMNIMINAYHAIGDGKGRIGVALAIADRDEVSERGLVQTPESRFARITISDTGSGMDGATLSRIFDPFFTTKEVGTGTGLGLSSAYSVVTQHEGTIAVDSEPGAGTTFSVYLPVSPSNGASDRER